MTWFGHSQGAFLFLDRYPRPVSYSVISPGEPIKDGSLTTIWIANQSKGFWFLGIHRPKWFLPARERVFVPRPYAKIAGTLGFLPPQDLREGQSF